MRRAAAILFGATVLLASIGPAAAAEAPAPKSAPAAKAAPATIAPAPAPAAPPPPSAPLPPYEPQLLRLAQLMGALAYLRDLCGQGDSAEFRAKMAALLDAEGLDEQRRDLLAGAYNKGFHDYATTYRVCTPAADEVVARYLTETARLAADVASRYGG